MHTPFDAIVGLQEALPDGRIHGSSEDIQIQSLCTDWRRVRMGDLFVALHDAQHDGHDHVQQAVQRGACAVLGERLTPINIPQMVVPDSRLAHSRLCLELAGRPDKQMRMIAVSGSGGKTVTSLLMTSVLHQSGRRVGLTSSIGYSDSEDTAPARETTPRAPELATWLGRMAENGCDDAVIEIDRQALADRRVGGLPLQAAVLTNLRTLTDELRGHLNTRASQQRVKSRMFQQLGPEGVAIINADDPYSMELAGKLPCPCLTVGIRQPADVTATIVETTRADQIFLLHAGTETVAVRTRMLGQFHVENCLAAAAAGLVLDVPLTEIVAGLEALDRVPGRLDRVVAGQSCGVFLDASVEPQTLAANLAALRQVTRGRLVCVFGAHPSEESEVCAVRGRIVEKGADAGIATSHHCRRKASRQLLHDVVDGYRRPAAAHMMPCRESAIRWALNEADAADTVLIAGAHAEERELVESTLRAMDEPVIFPINDYRRS